MAKKIIGTILLILGVFIALVLFTYGGPVFPHLVGPIILVTIGLFLIFIKGKVTSQ